MSSPIHFGTGGWRAVIARDFTFANIVRVARAPASPLPTARTHQALSTGQVSGGAGKLAASTPVLEGVPDR